MTLSEFIKDLNASDLDDLAKRCGTSAGYLRQVAGNHRRCGESLAISLERETSAAITCEDLRPDVDWAYLRSTSAA